MDASGSYDPDASGDYYRAPRMTCWESSGNGTWFFYDARGNKLINGITTDGWYTGADGQWRQELGMACFAPGIYRSFYVNENTENEKWEFSVYTSMSWEEWTLHGPSDKREDQFVRKKNKPHSPVFQDHAAYKRLYRNTNFYYLPICLATSSAKFSSFFSRPSPVSKRTNLLTVILALFSFATCATY